MAIGSTIEESLLKAVQSLELDQQAQTDLIPTYSRDMSMGDLLEKIKTPTDYRLFEIFAAIGKGATIQQINRSTQIDLYFLSKLENILKMQQQMTDGLLSADMVLKARKLGFNNTMIKAIHHATDDELVKLDQMEDQHLVYKMVDTCAAEFDSTTPYYYSTVGNENESKPLGNSIVVIGARFQLLIVIQSFPQKRVSRYKFLFIMSLTSMPTKMAVQAFIRQPLLSERI